ncbi:MAG: hypothetical protein JSU05_09465 [Bacteroidetes bacterium]|nr:hypothetical protein [Bacteroidota bacterium]
MKIYFKRIAVSGFALLFFIACNGQQSLDSTSKTASWVPESGYWVIKSNIHSPKNATVLFYSNDGILVYEESVSGKKINVKRKRTLKLLKSVLDRSVIAWNEQNPVDMNKGYLARLGK